LPVGLVVPHEEVLGGWVKDSKAVVPRNHIGIIHIFITNNQSNPLRLL